MAKDRLQVCVNYEYEGGPCDKRGISVYHKGECQTCAKYQPRKGEIRTENKKAKLYKLAKDRRDWDY